MNYIEDYLTPETLDCLAVFPESIELSVRDSLYERGFKDGYNFAKVGNNDDI